jgi:flagellar hook-associated protein 3 FlgL
VDSLQALQSNVGVLTDRLSDAASEVQSEQSADNTQLASTQDADEATLTTQYSTESAAYEAALEAGAKIIEESLTDFLSS